MKYYFVCSTKSNIPFLKKEKVKRILLSYFSFSKANFNDEIFQDWEIFLDSGAFSAFSIKAQIDIDSYIEFIKRYHSKLKLFSCLDVIGDEDKTLENQKYIEEKLKELNIKPLPVFHFGSDLTKLQKLAEEYDYLALGGLVPYSKQPKILKNWLDKCFKVLIPFVLKKKLKIHGFGIGNPELMKRYPFYSCDSTSYLSGGMFGTLIKWDSQNYRMLSSGFHYSEKEKMLDHNVSVRALENYIGRIEHNIKEYLEMEKDITELWVKRGIVWD